jgi:hypothetical protein
MNTLFTCTLDQKKIVRLFNFTVALGNLTFFIALIVYSYQGFFSRYWADDYCFSAIYYQQGLIGGLGTFYNTVSNRYAAYLFVALSELFGINAIRVLPAIMIVGMALGLTWNFRLVFLCIGLPIDRLSAFLIGQMMLFFTLLEAPNLFQSLYWRSGMVSYFAPLLILVLISGLIISYLDKIPRWWLWILLPVLAFLAAGASETCAAVQTGAIAIGLLGLIIFQRTRNRKIISWILLTALVASSLAMLVMILSPGNQLRLGILAQAPNVWTVIRLSFKHALDFAFYSLKGMPVPIMASFLIAFILSYHLSSNQKTEIGSKQILIPLLVVLGTAYLLLVCTAAPTAYGMMAYPEERAWMVGRFIMVVATVLIGIGAGIYSHHFMDRIVDTCVMTILILGLLCLYPLRAAWQTYQMLPEAQMRATAWDERHSELISMQNQGIQQTIVPAFDSIHGVYELTSDPQFWVNQCAARYYGLESIKAVE